MKTFQRFSFHCVLGFCCALPCRSGDIADWVTQLGAKTFAEREAASLSLWTLGDAAVAELRVAVNHPDPEIRFRAATILENVEGGLRPSWPEALRERAKAYRAYTNDQRQNFLRELTTAKKGEALPFLLRRLRGGESDAGTAVDMITGLLDTDEHRSWIAAHLGKPGNEKEATVLTRTLIREKSALREMATLLSSPHLTRHDYHLLVQISIQQLRVLLERQEFAEMEVSAGNMEKAAEERVAFLREKAKEAK